MPQNTLVENTFSIVLNKHYIYKRRVSKINNFNTKILLKHKFSEERECCTLAVQNVAKDNVSAHIRKE